MIADLCAERQRLGWSQAKLAEALGTTASTIADWEEGVSQPSPLFLQALRALFNWNSQEVERIETYTAQSENRAFLLLPNTSSMLPVGRQGLQERERQTEQIGPLGPGAREFERSSTCDPLLPNPPRGTNSLIGREALLQQLQQCILNQRNLALYGLPGAGKTALAVALAYLPEIQAHFSDGILWAGLGVNPHFPGILRRWSNMVGMVSPRDKATLRKEEWRNMLASSIEGRRLLIILDDAWQAEAVEALQVGSSECVYVLTTRFAHIAGHLDNSDGIRVPELSDEDGMRLLTRFVPEVVQQEYETARELVRAVGGLPLALSLMSKYLGSSGAMRQPRRLQTALAHLRNAERRLRLHVPQSLLENSSALPPGAKLSIESVIAVSDYHLPEAARSALRALAVLPSRPTLLTREAALAIADTNVEMLAMLCDAGLLEQHGADYYAQHILIADYARTQGPDEDALARLILYGTRFIAEHHTDAPGLERESAVLLAALDQASEAGQDDVLIRSSHLFVPWLFRWGWYGLAEELLQHTLSAVERSGQPRDRLQTLENQSMLAYLQGKYTEAQTYGREGLALARQHRNQEKIIGLLTILGDIAHELGDYLRAEKMYQDGYQLARQHGKQERISALLKSLGLLAKKRGNYARAREYYQQGLELARQLNQHELVSRLLINLGVIATEQGEYPQAQEYYQQGLELARQLGHREHICTLYANLGVLADARGDYGQAETSLREGLELAREIGHR
jgi:tetratricopeptide (TPR) repeat protein